MPDSLWPSFTSIPPRRGMVEMLYDAAGDIAQLTSNKLDFHVETGGISASGLLQNMRHNCYLRVISKAYLHLLFQVKTPVTTPFEAALSTPEGETFPHLKDEPELREAIRQVLARPRTVEVVQFLLNLAPGSAGSPRTASIP
jgi:hypothetical protein